MKIGVNTYAFRKELSKNELTLTQIFTILAKFKDVFGIELLDRHILESYGSDLSSRIGKIKQEAESYGLSIYALGPHLHCWNNSMSQVEKEVKDFKTWIDAAHANGIPALRMQGGRPALFWDNFLLKKALDVYGRILNQVIPYAEANSVKLGLETHWAHTSNPEFLKLFAEKYGKSPSIAIIFDWGNFKSDKTRFKALEVASQPNMHVHNHVKMFNFDPKTGLCTDWDAYAIVDAFRKNNFKGTFSIEYEGKEDGITGVFRSLEVLRYCLSEKKHQIDLTTDPHSFL